MFAIHSGWRLRCPFWYPIVANHQMVVLRWIFIDKRLWWCLRIASWFYGDHLLLCWCFATSIFMTVKVILILIIISFFIIVYAVVFLHIKFLVWLSTLKRTWCEFRTITKQIMIVRKCITNLVWIMWKATYLMNCFRILFLKREVVFIHNIGRVWPSLQVCRWRIFVLIISLQKRWALLMRIKNVSWVVVIHQKNSSSWAPATLFLENFLLSL